MRRIRQYLTCIPERNNRTDTFSGCKESDRVEIVEEAVVAARENAALNGLTNCEFIAGDVLKVIDTIGENRIISYLIRQEMESIRKHWRKSSAIMCRRWSIFPVNRPA